MKFIYSLNKHKYALVFCVFALLGIQKSKSQIVVLGDSTNLAQLYLNECGKPDTFTTYLRIVTGSLSGTVTLTDTFSNHFILTGVIGNAAILSYSGIGTSIVKLTLDGAVINASGATAIKLKFLIRAKCGANALSSANHNMLLTANSYSLLKTGNDFISSIKLPVLVFSEKSGLNNTTATLGNTYSRFLKIQNSGVNSEIDTIQYYATTQPGIGFQKLYVNGVLTSPAISSGGGIDTIRLKIIFRLRDISNFPNDSILIEEQYKVNACTVNGSHSDFEAYWGCLQSSKCEVANLIGNVSVLNTVPSLNWIVSENRINTCWNNYDTMVFRIVNSSSAIASNVFFSVANGSGLDHLPSSDGTASRLDTSRAIYKYGKNGIWKKPSKKNYENHTAYNAWFGGIKGAHRVDYGVGTLNGGDTIFIMVPYYKPCPANGGETALMAGCGGYSQWYWGNYKGQVNYSNVCNTNQYTTNNTAIWINGRYSFLYMANQALVAPTDVNAGQTITVDLQENYGVRNMSGSVHKHFFLRKINIPNGLKYTGSNPLYFGPSNRDTLSYDTTSNIIWLKFSALSQPIYSLQLKAICGTGGKGNFIDRMYLLPANGCGSTCDSVYFTSICTREINVHCPVTCNRGGYLAKSLTQYRISYGLPDNNNDRLPDPSGSINLSLIKRNQYLNGDTMEILSTGTIVRGSQSPTLPFVKGYASIVMANNWFEGITADVFIKDTNNAGSATNYTITNLPVSTISSGGKRILRVDWSVTNLTSAGVPSGYEFGQNDSISIKIRTTINSNAPYSVDIISYVYTDTIFVSHYANPKNDTAKYSCDNYNSTWNLVGTYRFAHPDGSGGISVNGCTGGEFRFRTYQRLGGYYPYGGIFPYEYRPITYPDTFYFDLPPGFGIKKTVVYWQFSSGNYSDTLKLTRKSGSRYYFAVRQLIKGFGGTRVISDEGDYVDFGVTLIPTCQTTTTDIPVVNFGQTWFSARPQVTNWGTGTTPILYATSGSGSATFPNIDISNSGAANAAALNKIATWDFKIQNNSNAVSSPLNFVSFRSKKNGIFVDSIKLNGSGANISNSAGIFRLGNLASSGANKIFKIYAHYTSCNADTLVANVGWDCLAYPTTISAINCKYDSSYFILDTTTAIVQSQLITTPTNPVDLCDTLEYIVSVSSRQLASVYGTQLDVVIPDGGTGAKLVPNYGYKYPYTASTFTKITPVNLGGGIYRFYLSDSILAIKTNGLRPIGEAPNNELYLKIRILSNCNFISGSNIKFITRGKKSCGANLTPDLEYSPVTINGAPTAKLHLISENVPSITKCDSSFNVSVKIYNYEFSATGSNDLIRITLPDGANFIPNSTLFSKNTLSPVQPKIDTIGGRQRLEWTSNSIPALDSSVFEFKYESKSNVACGSINEFKIQTISKFTATCGLSSCISFVENAKRELNRPISKPKVEFVGGVLRIFIDTTIGNKYFADTLIIDNVQLRNTGTKIAQNVLTYFYEDANHNNKYDLGDIIWYKDTALTIGIGSVYNITKLLSYGHLTLPDTMKIYTFVKCNCENSEFNSMPFPATMLNKNLNFHKVNLINNIATLYWTNSNENNLINYEIQRLNTSNSLFTKVGIQPPSKDIYFNKYQYLDSVGKLSNGKITYRIKSIYNNGFVEYSNSISVYKLSKIGVQIVPNPNQGDFKLFFDNSLSSSIEIIGIDGRLIQVYEVKDQNQLMLNIAKPGIYLIKISQNGFSEIQKVLVE